MLNRLDIKTKELKEWLDNHSKICEIPNSRMVYSPQRGSSFSFQGEKMVQSLIKIGEPAFEYALKCVFGVLAK